MNAENAARAFADAFAAVYRHTYRRRDPREPRVSGEALAMLQHLRDSGPLTITEAARHFGRSQSSVSERIQRLVRRGLLVSLADERDRRRHLIWLTPRGEDALRVETEVLSEERLTAAMRRLGATDRTKLLDGMLALLTAAGEVAREKGKG
jgi:DNA-binding MarR family transcriptional regulator